MPSPCDLVQDALTMSDALAFGIGQSVPDDPDHPLRIGDSYAIGVLVPFNDTLTIGDSVIEMWTMGVADSLTIHDAVADHLVTASLLRDALFIGDATRVAISDRVSDALSIRDATSVGVAQTVADALHISDGVLLFTRATSLLSDALRIGDASQTGFASLVADALHIGDAINQRQSVVSLVRDVLHVGDSAGVAAVVVELARDALTIGDAIRQALSTASLVIDNLIIGDRAAGGSSGAWSAHAEPFAMSRYDGFGFNSMAEVGGRLLLAGEGGIFLSGANDDAGIPIAARIEHDLSDTAPDARGEMKSDDHHKRPRYLYVSYHSSGQIGFQLGFIAENDTLDGWVERSATYAMPAMNSTQFRTGRVALDRGIRSRYLRPILMNVSGADFAMNDAYLKVDSVKRKV